MEQTRYELRARTLASALREIAREREIGRSLETLRSVRQDDSRDDMKFKDTIYEGIRLRYMKQYLPFRKR
jgi:hypothetical protein